MIDRSIVTKSIFDLEHRVIREDGTIGWTHSRAIPLLGLDGQMEEWFGSADDITQRRRVQGAFRESEERLRVLVEGVPQLVWRSESGGRWSWSSPQWHRYTGLSDAESRGNAWLAAVHPDDREQVMSAWHTAAETHRFEIDCRLRHLDLQEYRWFSGRATPLLDERSRITEWLGTFTDIRDQRVAQERQGVLLAELQHRVRNMLAIMRSIATRSAANSDTVEELSMHLEGRLASLARTQVILTRQAGTGIYVEDMIRDELLAQDEQVAIEGPEVIVAPKAAEVLTLAVHELTTNSVKYGLCLPPMEG